MTRFLLIRHGQTPWNVERRVQGLTDIPLNEEGVLQAQRLAERLKSETIHHVYSSHLSRARQTAEIVAAHHPNAPFELLEDLAEFGMGPVEGLKIEDAHAQYTPNFWDDEELRQKLGMELRSTYLERFRGHITSWLEKHDGQTVLLSSHGGKLKTILNSFDLPHPDLKLVQEKHLGNCSLTIVEAQATNHRLALYSCEIHLGA